MPRSGRPGPVRSRPSMARLRIVLVEPREGGNVGAVARAMKNFGFGDLVIAGNAPPLHPVAEWWASGADDVLDALTLAPSLNAALADAHLSIATTSSRGRDLPTPLTPLTAAELFAALGPSQTLALVFGREDRGLTSAETSTCQRTATIPASAVFPTLNLAQSVAIFCYEMSRATAAAPVVYRQLAEAAALERLHDGFRDLLLRGGFLDEQNPDHIYAELRALAGRLSLDEREAVILQGVLRRLLWRIDHQS
ncbi:MAG: RNA methyltransferase [Acidobacteriota bacterium]